MDHADGFLRSMRCVLGLVVVMGLGAVWVGCDTGTSPLDDSGRPIAWVGGQKLTSADLRFDWAR